MHKKMYLRIILIVMFLFIFLLSFIGIKYFFKQKIRENIKNNLFKIVISRENEFKKSIDEIKKNEWPKFIHIRENDKNTIAYKKINNRRINRLFNKYHLNYINNCINEKYIEFNIIGFMNYVWNDDYEYGFYYTEGDKSINVVTGENVEPNIEVMGKIPSFCSYKYKIEKIINNWWYYERKFNFHGYVK